MNHTHLFKDWEDDGDVYTLHLDFINVGTIDFPRTTVMVMKSNPTIISINGIHVPYSDEIIERANAMVKK
jgi:hypothetical protein